MTESGPAAAGGQAMSEERELRCVGGPWDGTVLRTRANVVQIDGYPGMAYVSTRPTDTNWREEYDPDWFIKNLPEPVAQGRVLEWHEEGWLSPEVAAIRIAFIEASASRDSTPDPLE